MHTYVSMCGICDVQNEEVNGHYKNTEFKCADVTALDLKIPEASADIVFSNWLLMYLSDHEVETTPIPPPLSLCLSLVETLCASNCVLPIDWLPISPLIHNGEV